VIAGPRLYGGYLFDLDGTVYLGDALLPDARETVLGLRAAGARTLFLSNNPTRNATTYADKLTRLGIPTSPEEVVNPLVTMVDWLRRHTPGARLFVIGEEPLQAALRAAGFRLVDRAEDVDVVVASYDRQFDYRKLQVAFDALWQHRGAILVTTNPDPYCPLAGGRGEPDAAAVVAAIEACTGVRCTANVGKPDPLMAGTALSVIGLPPTECVMVGDRLRTDIAMAVDAGLDSALVLTGESTRADVAALPADRRPTHVLEGIGGLLPASLRRAMAAASGA
jgi:HAD superfamily hydrolase (TIGR01450 family)